MEVMDKCIILLNKMPLSNIYKDHNSGLITMDYDDALVFVEKLKKTN